MKQKANFLFTVAFCLAAFCSCSKHTAQQATATAASTPVSKGLNLNTGQKLQIESTVKTMSTMDLMGQSMEINADVVIIRQLEVKEKKEKTYQLVSTITKMNLNSSFMGQSMSYDSDKKEDSDNEMGKMMKGQLNVPKEIELDDDGKLITVKKDTVKSAADGSNPMLAMMESMGAAQDESNGVNEAFQVLPPGAKTGDTWSDSTVADGSKIYRTYTITGIQGNDATIALSGTQAVNKTVENQGIEATVSLDSKISGEILVDKSTGVVKQRTLVVEGTGNTAAMGQEIPMTTKVTTTSVIKNL
jgi:hypothetical protein